jgi:hypothetical protein
VLAPFESSAVATPSFSFGSSVTQTRGPGDETIGEPPGCHSDYGSAVRILSRIRLTTWLLIAWTALGAVGAYWGYWSVMESCPPEEGFSGCFEPPYRFAASFVFVLWGAVETVLMGAWLLQRWGNRR